MSEQIFVDPKTQYLTSLIRHVDKITFFISGGLLSSAALELGVLLDRVNIPENRKDLTQLRIDFDEENYIDRTRNDVRVAFRKISAYLNATYFKGYDAQIKDKDFEELEGSEE